MSNTDMTKGSVKTLAIRLEPDVHAQLSVIAQLRSTTITDEIREAIAAHVDRRRSAPELAAQASAVLADIDRDAETRRGAIAALFGGGADGGEVSVPAMTPPPSRGRRRTAKEEPVSES